MIMKAFFSTRAGSVEEYKRDLKRRIGICGAFAALGVLTLVAVWVFCGIRCRIRGWASGPASARG